MSNVELGVQTEKALQKQPIFQNSKAARKTTRDRRWYKDVGLGFKTPRAAIDGTYIGKFPNTPMASSAGRWRQQQQQYQQQQQQQVLREVAMVFRSAELGHIALASDINCRVWPAA
jgi:hypothetical protein